jgi:NACHT domain
VKITESHIRKSDPILLDRLTHAQEGEVLRVSMTLNAEPSEAGQALTTSTLEPSQFLSRIDYRQALIQQQQVRLATELGSTIQYLQELSLKTYGGTTSRVIIAEGTAAQIIQSLELTGVHHVSFDQSIGIPPNPSSDETLKSAKYLTGIATEIFKNHENKYDPDIALICSAFETYVENYKNCNSLLRVLGMFKPVELESVYTDVRLLNDTEISQTKFFREMETAYRENRRWPFQNSLIHQQNGLEIINQEQLLMVLGSPGAGKSTFLRRIGLESLKDNSQLLQDCRIPVSIELKQLNHAIVNINNSIVNEFKISEFPEAQVFVLLALQQGKLRVMLDGLDEVPNNKLTEVVNEIKNFVKQYPRNQYIFSCRTAAYRREFPNFTNVIMAEFEDNQIREFINNWFQSLSDRQANTAERCWNALQQSEQKGAKELSHTPLLLTFLCLVYDRSQVFPSNRSVLYRKALRILIEEWAAEKRISMDSIYQGLSTELERMLLSEIAANGFENSQISFSHHELIEKIQAFLSGNLNASNQLDSEAILNAVVVQQGILVERASDAYFFSHLTFQEYLTAQYIVDQQRIKDLVSKHLTDRHWREVFLLVSGLLPRKADELLLLIESQIMGYIMVVYNGGLSQEDLLCSEHCFYNLLKWADLVTVNSVGQHKSAAKRIAAIVLALTLQPKSFSDNNLGRVFDLSLNLARTLGLDLSETNNMLSHTFNNDLPSTDKFRLFLKCAQEYEAMGIFGLEAGKNLVKRLESCSSLIPGNDHLFHERRAFVEWIRKLWLDVFQIDQEMLRLSPSEIKALQSYLYAYELLVSCKKAAVIVSPQIWSGIEQRMLIIRL